MTGCHSSSHAFAPTTNQALPSIDSHSDKAPRVPIPAERRHIFSAHKNL